MRKPEQELGSALDRIVRAGLLLRQGVPPHGSYLFKHALIQDAAYGTLLREPRRALHARIAETLERDFPDIAGAASGADQAASRSHYPVDAYQRIQRPGNQGGCGAGTFADRTG